MALFQAISNSRDVDQVVVTVVAHNDRVQSMRSWHITVDNQFLSCTSDDIWPKTRLRVPAFARPVKTQLPDVSPSPSSSAGKSLKVRMLKDEEMQQPQRERASQANPE